LKKNNVPVDLCMEMSTLSNTKCIIGTAASLVWVIYSFSSPFVESDMREGNWSRLVRR